MFRKPSWYSVAFVSLLAAMAVVPTAAHLCRARREAAIPHTLEEVAERIRTAHPEWCIIPAAAYDDIRFGFYVSSHPHTYRELSRLQRDGRNDPMWLDIIYVCYDSPRLLHDDADPLLLILSPFLLYGDRILLDRIISLMASN